MDYKKISEEFYKEIRTCAKISLNEILKDCNKGELGVLEYLVYEENPTTAGNLSEHLGVTTARTAKILNVLEAKGYIKRKNNLKDKRITEVRITPKGRQLSIKCKLKTMEKISVLLKELGEEDLKEFMRLVLRINEVANKNFN